MSEPVILERWKQVYEEAKNKYTVDLVDAKHKKIIEELGAAQAKVAELKQANEFARHQYDRNESSLASLTASVKSAMVAACSATLAGQVRRHFAMVNSEQNGGEKICDH